MSIRRVLVHLDDSNTCDDRLKTSLLIANSFHADIHGVYVEPQIPASLASETNCMNEFSEPVTHELTPHIERVKQQKKSIEDKLESIRQSSLQSIHWQSKRGNTRRVLSELGLFNDLIIMTNEIDGDPLLQVKPPATDIAVHTSCPVLVIPNNKPLKASSNNVLLTWNGSVESSSAIHQSLPFLTMANNITLFCARGEHVSITDYEASKKSMLQYLRAHNLSIDMIDQDKSDKDISELLEQQITNHHYDLLVTGAYDHSNIRELLFSSTTKELLDNEKIPLLLAH
jgi:hypothetical protein